MKRIESLVTNVVNFDDNHEYVVIIGSNPSITARSPKLWNSVYESLSSSRRMVPLDVSVAQIEPLMSMLIEDQRCIGGCVAVPFKQNIYSQLSDTTDLVVKQIGAVNCFYRKDSSTFGATNTDGLGARHALFEVIGNFSEKNILLIGLGGAGKAVAAFLANELEDRSTLTCSNRDSNAEEYSHSIGAVFVKLDEIRDSIRLADIIINCTSVGFGNLGHLSILDEIEISLISEDALVFDIIYNPAESVLLSTARKFGLRTLNGLSMNLEQAVQAFCIVNNMSDCEDYVRNMMRN